MQQNGELSVEEILESIKKVIARDNKEGATIERHRRENEGVILRGPGATFGVAPISETGNDDDIDSDPVEDFVAASEDEDEVLDLGAAAEEMIDAGGEEPAETDPQMPEHVAEWEIEPAPVVELVETAAQEADLEIAAETITETAVEAFTPTETVAATTTQAGDTPIERMVRESLQPMLREWLDTNLPPMVDRIVRSELNRIMGRPG